MQSFRLALLLAAVSATVSLAQTPPPAVAEKTPADLAYDAIWTAYNAKAPAGIEHPSKEFFKWSDGRMQEFAAAVRAFGERFPDDSRRYEGWVQASYTGPSFIVGFKPDFDTKPAYGNLLSDEAAVLAYRTEQVRRLQLVLAADDATDRQRGGAFHALIIDSGTVARLKGETLALSSFRPLVDRLAAKFADARALPIVEQYAGLLRRESPAEADAFVASLQDKPALAAALQAVEEKRRTAEAEQARKRAALASLQFTAVDGREVDLAKLRGKVVLIDFWATWCGPCIAELPNVKKVYAAYHDKGFEVIGITLERAGVGAQDTPAQAKAKLEAAKKKLLTFLAKNELPWPQHFDGKHFQNDYAVQFGIEAIPAMFLLDRDGRLQHGEARGERLEAEVKRLLGL